MYILKLTNCRGYIQQVSVRNTLLFLCFRSFLQINDLTPPLGLVFMKFGNLGRSAYLNTYVFFAYLFAVFEILSGHPQF